MGEPSTPEQPSTQINVPPTPRPSSSSCRLPRVRVRSGTDVCARMDMDLAQLQGLSDVPLPSIEVPESNADCQATLPEPSVVDDEHFLAPPRERPAFKTPPAQIRGTPFESCDTVHPWPAWDQTPLASTIHRPDSACSSMSDSSIESIETFASRPSVGGSCTSVDSDGFDHYFPLEIAKSETWSPSLPQVPKQHQSRTSDKPFTREMDNHLWNTYQLYLQDPTITPFKMTPGSIPPLGVTHRVARRAKRTWDKKRHRIRESLPTMSADRSGSSTPKAPLNRRGAAWPKSDTTTRRRLKHLCRRKFSISPHYQRMMQSRSPEPAAEMFKTSSDPRADEFADHNSMVYATRDLGVSLVSSHGPPPCCELPKENPTPQEPKVERFNNPVQTAPGNAADKHPTPHLSVQSAGRLPRLGSPFVYNTWGPGTWASRTQDPFVSAGHETVHVPSRRVRPRIRAEVTPLHQGGCTNLTPVLPENDSEEAERRLELYLRDNQLQDIGHGRVRIRNRGATTGAFSSRGVNQLFSPPLSQNSSHPEETTPKPPVNAFLNIGGESIKRLGSPFNADGGFKHDEAPNRFTKHTPSNSDPFSSGVLASHPKPTLQPPPIQEQDNATGPLPYDPSEEGLSDAECIRRQILNMPYVRK